MKTSEEWKPFMVMIAIDFSSTIVNILLKKVLEEGMDHLVFITYRLSISTIFLVPISYFWERNGRPRLTFRILCYLFFSAIVGASVTQYFFLLGIQYTSATFACAFVNMVPVITFIMALPFGLETLNIKCNSGKAKILAASTGMRSAMKQRSSPPTRIIEKWTIGVIALILGTLFWSSWFILQSTIGKLYPCRYSSTAIMTLFGAIQSAILALSTGRDLSMWIPNGRIQILTVLYSGMVGSGLCYVGMSWCVKKRGPVFTAAFSPLVQIMSAMIDIPVLHEQLHLGSVLGSMLVMVGLYILLWGKSKDNQNGVTNLVEEGGNKEQVPPPQTTQHVAITCDTRSN
ncbi:hypothetical protein AHAS_Ahas13G0530700 [Arachis hypogaea]